MSEYVRPPPTGIFPRQLNFPQSTHSPGFGFLPLPLRVRQQLALRSGPLQHLSFPPRACRGNATRRIPNNGQTPLYRRHFGLADYEYINQSVEDQG